MIVTDSTFAVKPRQSKRKTASKKPQTKLELCSGEKVKVKQYGKRPQPVPPPPVLTIGKLVSLELTFQEYGIEPNAKTARKLGV